MSEIIFSIIMPTYNSECYIEKALQSIRMQDFPQNQIEILVIDGGSSDKTLDIARQYRTDIYINKRKFPEYAKQIGIAKAKGKYIVEQDSDEVLTDREQLANRLKIFEQNQEVNCVLPNRVIAGENCGISCHYLNTLGDPFYYIVYRPKGSFLKNNKKYQYKITELCSAFHYTSGDLCPIGDGGTTTIDLQKAKELFGDEVYSTKFAASACSMMLNESGYIACAEKDNIVHYSYTTLKGYLRKQRFKIVQNLTKDESAGFASREGSLGKFRYRKYLFVLYALTVILPLLDSVRLAVLYKDYTFLLHFVYTYYIFIVLAVECIKMLFGMKKSEIKYGK